jgi:glycosyltransferase involved in cell wall biosynthesis
LVENGGRVQRGPDDDAPDAAPQRLHQVLPSHATAVRVVAGDPVTAQRMNARLPHAAFAALAADTLGRNAPCVCGTGLRYKACHGRPDAAAAYGWPPAVGARMQRAVVLQLQDRAREAVALYREALALAPDLPDAVHMLGVACFQAGDHDAALRELRRAAELFDWQLPAVRHNVGLAIAALLPDDEIDSLAQRWADYDRWRDALAPPRGDAPVPVSVVVPTYNHAGYVEAALASVFAQTHAHIELIVIDDGSRDATPRLVDRMLRDCPFPYRFVARENRGAAATINEAVALSSGAFVNVLNSDDRYAPTRIATMVAAIARRGLDWGFSRVALIDGAGAPLGADASPLAAELLWRIDDVAARHSVGTGFLTCNAATSSGALFFSRALYDRLGGFADLRYNHDWDFCLRASLVSEPLFVPSPEYEYRLHGANTILESKPAAKAEADRMFERFYRTALAQEAPANPFAPVPAVWGAGFYDQVLGAGHAAQLPPAALREIADWLLAVADES